MKRYEVKYIKYFLKMLERGVRPNLSRINEILNMDLKELPKLKRMVELFYISGFYPDITKIKACKEEFEIKFNKERI